MLRWLFLDMNSYFASVEQQDRPELRDRPVGVVPVDSRHTCCIAASYEAKALGIRTGTSVGDARAMCPDVRLIVARPRRYIEVHRRILTALDRFAPVDKVYSIDEVAIRLSPAERPPDAARQLGARLKRAIYQDVGAYLRCSVGVAPTRLLAKIACELHKPDGLTLLDVDELPDRLADLDLKELPGINTGIEGRLHAHGVRTIAELWAMSRQRSRAAWGGAQGEHWWYGFHGHDMPEVHTHRQSMGHGHVLPGEFRDDEGSHAVLVRLLHKLGHRLRHHGYWARRLDVSVRFLCGRRWGDGIDLPACRDTLTLVDHFERLWARRPAGMRHGTLKPKKVQITTNGLTPEAFTPQPLFAGDRTRHELAATMDRINQRWGCHAIYLGGMHASRRHVMEDKIAFGRVPDETLAM